MLAAHCSRNGDSPPESAPPPSKRIQTQRSPRLSIWVEKGRTNPLQKDQEAQAHQGGSAERSRTASVSATRQRGLNDGGIKSNQISPSSSPVRRFPLSKILRNARGVSFDFWKNEDFHEGGTNPAGANPAREHVGTHPRHLGFRVSLNRTPRSEQGGLEL